MISETSLARVSVSDVMHTGILMTDPVTPLTVVARLMAERGVHAVVVADDGRARRPLSIISTLDVAGAVARCEGEVLTAGQAAQTEVTVVPSDKSIEEAASIMAENQIEHLMVIDPSSGHAEGILSSLDVAGVLAGRPGL